MGTFGTTRTVLLAILVSSCQHSRSSVSSSPSSIDTALSESCAKKIQVRSCDCNKCEYEYSYIIESDARQCVRSAMAATDLNCSKDSDTILIGKESNSSGVAGLLLSALVLGVLTVISSR